MKSFHLNKYNITALIFILFIFMFGTMTLIEGGSSMYHKSIDSYKKSTSYTKRLKGTIGTYEKEFNNKFYLKTKFIDGFGLEQRLLGKKVINDVSSDKSVIKDKDGFLLFTNDKQDVTDNAKNLVNMQDFLNKTKTPFLYIQAPYKILKDYTNLPIGIEDYTNKNVDEFINVLKSSGVNYVDLREEISKDKLDKEQLFFKTDHHWRIETVFWVYQKTIGYIEERFNIKLDKDNYYTDRKNFNIDIYKNNFLGSQGQRVSKYYGGIDDFALVTPKFKTDLELTQILEDKVLHIKQGEFKDSLIYKSMMESKDGYSIDSYASYLGYGNTEKRIVNNKAANNYKVLVIGDSFSRPLTSFLSLCFKETRNIDTQKGRFNKNVYDYITEYKPDMVIVLVNGGSCGDKDVFNFYK